MGCSEVFAEWGVPVTLPGRCVVGGCSAVRPLPTVAAVNVCTALQTELDSCVQKTQLRSLCSVLTRIADRRIRSERSWTRFDDSTLGQMPFLIALVGRACVDCAGWVRGVL
jgi:hypothetical protein